MAFSFISDMWSKWNIRGFVILSLLLQVFLILFAPFRKKTANHRVVFLLWLAYLMADWVAAFGIGLISHNQGDSSARATQVDGSLQAFWASFLLLHLGGPDTIAAFSLEDSSLWPRHLLSLIFQVGAAIYVFVQIFPNNKSLVIPTMLVFLAGVIKSAERLLALNLSSLPKLRESMLSQLKPSVGAYKKLVKELNVLGDEYSDEEEAKLAESIVVRHAYNFFQIFKVFIGDLIFTRKQREMSRQYFYKVSAVDALRVISVELHFMYEVLHTKALAIRSKWGYIFRFIAFIDILMAFVLFNHLKKHRLLELDVEITYYLLFGGIAIDVIALFMLIFSDWTVAGIECYETVSFLHKLVSTTDDLRKPRFATCEAKPNANISSAFLDTPLIFRRWSESIFACNLLSESLKKSPTKMYKHDRSWCIIAFSNICNFPFYMAEKIISYFHQAGETIARCCAPRCSTDVDEKIPIIAYTKYVSNNPFAKELWIFIFKEVKRKSENADDLQEVRKIFEARGDLFLQSRPGGINCDNLLVYVANFDMSIIVWHIATEIWYNREKHFVSSTTRNDEREFSKILSDYMLYLLFNQPKVVSAVVGIAQMRAAQTLRGLQHHISDATTDVEELCTTLFGKVPSGIGGGNISPKSALGQGILLAQEMESLGERKWMVMSGVWVEMLSYAAIHIKGEVHVQVLSKGGELLAFVWLLMAHFGCFYKPEWGMYNQLWGVSPNRVPG